MLNPNMEQKLGVKIPVTVMQLANSTPRAELLHYAKKRWLSL